MTLAMTYLSLHFPRSIEFPDHPSEYLFAPFGLQTTVDGRAILALRISKTTDDDLTYLQYYNMDTNETSFCCISDHFQTFPMTDFIVVKIRPFFVGGRLFDYAVVEFTDASFSTISQCRKLTAHSSISNEDSLDLTDRTFALGATVSGDYLYAAIAEEEGITATGIHSFKVRRFNTKRSILEDMGEVVAVSSGWTPLPVWQNGRLVITDDGFIDLVSRDLCNLAVIRLRLDPVNPENQQINRCLVDVDFCDEFNMVEYAMGNSANPTQQHCETSPQTILLGGNTLTCHPEGIFCFRLIRKEDGVVKEQIVNKIMEANGRLSSFCLSPCGRFIYTITILNEHVLHTLIEDSEFSEVWKCEKHVILDDEPSLENMARRVIVKSMESREEMRRDGSVGEVLYDCPKLAMKIIASYSY